MKKICPSCGVENEEKAKFCMNCAAKLSEKKTTDDSDVENEEKAKEKILCPECKKLIDIDVKKCPECGYVRGRAIEYNSTDNKKVSYHKIILIIVIIVLFIAVVGAILINRYEEKEAIFNDFQKSNLITKDLNNLEFKVPSNWGKALLNNNNSVVYVKGDKQVVTQLTLEDLGKSKNITDENGNITKKIIKEMITDSSIIKNMQKFDYNFVDVDSQYVFSYTNSKKDENWNGYIGIVSCNSEAFFVWCNVKKNAANDPEKIARTFFDTVNFSDYEPILNVEKISATYSGDTSAGTEITADSDDITVTAYYDDGSSEVLDNFDWTMNDSATLEPDKTSKFKIAYDGVTCTLKIKCSTKVNKERTLKKFVERYNAKADIMKKDKNITVKKLKEEDLDENQIETGIGATIIFNQSAEDTDCRYDIKSFMWSKSPWAFTDSEVLLANIYCCLAGYSSDNDYTTIGKIVSQIGEEATTGVYGSVHTGKYMYNMSVIKKEMTVGGQLDN